MSDQPYTEAEALASLAQAFGREPRDPATILLPPLSEDMLNGVGNADSFATSYGGRLKHVTGWGWVAYDGERWVKDAEKQAKEWAKQSLRDMAAQATGTRMEGVMVEHVGRSMSLYGIRSILELASSDPRIVGKR